MKRVSIIIHYFLSLSSSLFPSLAHKSLFVFSNMLLIYACIVYVYHISNILNFLHLFCHLTFSVTSLHVVSLLHFPYWSSSLNCLSFPCSFLLPSHLDVDDGIQLPHFNILPNSYHQQYLIPYSIVDTCRNFCLVSSL